MLGMFFYLLHRLSAVPCWFGKHQYRLKRTWDEIVAKITPTGQELYEYRSLAIKGYECRLCGFRNLKDVSVCTHALQSCYEKATEWLDEPPSLRDNLERLYHQP